MTNIIQNISVACAKKRLCVSKVEESLLNLGVAGDIQRVRAIVLLFQCSCQLRWNGMDSDWIANKLHAIQ